MFGRQIAADRLGRMVYFVRMAGGIRLDNTLHRRTDLGSHCSQSPLLRSKRMAYLLMDGLLLTVQPVDTHLWKEDPTKTSSCVWSSSHPLLPHHRHRCASLESKSFQLLCVDKVREQRWME